jgi:hypothetical protein
MPFGLGRSERTSSLTPADGGTTFRVREEFTGPLLGLIWRSRPDLQDEGPAAVRAYLERVWGMPERGSRWSRGTPRAGRDRAASDATDVSIRFVPTGEGTRVEIRAAVSG